MDFISTKKLKAILYPFMLDKEIKYVLESEICTCETCKYFSDYCRKGYETRNGLCLNWEEGVNE